jgi:ribonuclease HII
MLSTCYNESNTFEIGIDEAGRGPLFGRLYVAAAILPKGGDFHHDWMKDSKKFHSKKKIKEVCEYIKSNALVWSVQYIEHDIVDSVNIRNAVHQGMHNAVKDILSKPSYNYQNTFLLIDGNHFKPYCVYDETSEQLKSIPFETIEGGDNKYTSIAAASILAKVARDEYIEKLCETYPELDERYKIGKNKGYGTRVVQRHQFLLQVG